MRSPTALVLLASLVLASGGCSLLFDPKGEESFSAAGPDAGELAEPEPDAELAKTDAETDVSAFCPPIMPLRPELRNTEISRDPDEPGLLVGVSLVGDGEEEFLFVGLPEDAPTYQESFEGIFMHGGPSGVFIATEGELVVERLCDVGMAGTLIGATFARFDSETETIMDGPACEREVSIEFEMGLLCP